MEPFEYVMTLSSIILGLGIAQILTNVADIISNLRNVKLNLAHSLMVFVVFMQHIQIWWFSYQYSHQVEEWSVKLVIFLLLYPIALQTLSRMLFPTGWRGHETDLSEYYYDQWPRLFIVFTLLPITSFLHNVFISGYAWHEQILQMAYLFWLLLFLIFRIREKWAHNLFQGLQAAAIIAWVLFENHMLEA